ncbi:MAG TPA: DinB family protein [Dehalococcoidia bacterium]|jgi:hypothetical protein|nr:DinB family protein [Dehalococcoidia bacterium]
MHEALALEPGTIERYAATPGVLRALTAGLPAAVVEAPGPEGWSPKDVVAHLTSIQRTANIRRVTMMLEADDPLIPGIDEAEVLESSGQRQRRLPALLDQFERERAEGVALLRRLTADELARTGRHSVAGALTIADVVHHIAYHDLLHVGQIAALLAAAVEQRRGAMRIF